MISVCVATYNGGTYIREQIASILPQLSAGDELIVSDDASSDMTIQILEGFNDKRIKILRHKPLAVAKYPFAKITGNFHNALLHASGDVVFLCDQDDVWHPGKVKTVLHEMEDASLIVHNCQLVDDGGQVLASSYFDHIKLSVGVLDNLVHCSFLGCCMAVRRELLEKLLPFPTMQVPHDMWLGVLAGRYGRVRFVSDVLLDNRRHPEAQSAVAKKNTNTILFKLGYRITFLAAYLRYVIVNRS